METEQRPILMARPLAEPSEPDALSHHGILGQKWGVRRFQNKDGTLTRAGKERYLKEAEKSLEQYKTLVAKQKSYEAKAAVKAQKVKVKEAKKAEKKAVKTAKEEIKKEKLTAKRVHEQESINAKKEALLREANPDKIVKNQDLFSDAELKRALDRINNLSTIESKGDKYKKEQLRAEKAKANVKPKKKKIAVKDIAGVANDINSVVEGYNTVANVINGISIATGHDPKMKTIKTQLTDSDRNRAKAAKTAKDIIDIYGLKSTDNTGENWRPLTAQAIEHLTKVANGTLKTDANGKEYTATDRIIAEGAVQYNQYRSQAEDVPVFSYKQSGNNGGGGQQKGQKKKKG